MWGPWARWLPRQRWVELRRQQHWSNAFCIMRFSACALRDTARHHTHNDSPPFCLLQFSAAEYFPHISRRVINPEKTPRCHRERKIWQKLNSFFCLYAFVEDGHYLGPLKPNLIKIICRRKFLPPTENIANINWLALFWEENFCLFW